jgi:HlyD family secretion protein
MTYSHGMPDPLPVPKKRKKWLWVPALLLIAIVAAAAVMRPRSSDRPQPEAGPSSGSQKPVGVGSRGRIEPEDGVIVVAAPYFGGRPSLVSELRTREGDWLKAGQVVAILDGWRLSEKALRQSEADVEVARRKLAQVQAGSKPADIDAQKMEVARWESEYEIASSDHQRFENLREQQIVSASDLEQKRLVMERNKRTLDAAKERLKSLEEVRKEDVDVLAAQLSSAMAQVEHAAAELEQMVVRAPVNGKVLKIHAHNGEEVGSQGILELGKTDRMYVIAEVYESDVSRVQVGQTARISGELVPDGLTGTVTQISPQVTKSELLSLQPADFADTRVVRVKIQLQNSERAAGLIHGKVDVVIQP